MKIRCLLCFLFASLFISPHLFAQNQEETDAMLYLKSQWNPPGWEGEDICSWQGVFCNDQDTIVGIDLEDMGLPGPIPAQIDGLKYLEFLWLDGNSFYHLPSEIGNLSRLQSLNLSRNQFTSFPDEISSLKKLRILNLDQNPIEAIPPEIGNLLSLEALILGGGTFFILPDEMAQLQKLKTLLIFEAELTHFPQVILSLTSLESLTIFRTNLIKVPPEIQQLTNLRQLNLDYNNLHGLPSELLTLSHLEELIIRRNYLTIADLGPFHPNQSQLGRMLYNPQFSENALQHIYAPLGGSANFFIPETWPGSDYKWTKQGIDSVILGTDSVLTFSPVKKEDFGFYYCEITHPDFPDLLYYYSGFILEELNHGMAAPTYEIGPNPLQNRLVVRIKNGMGRSHEIFVTDTYGRQVFSKIVTPTLNQYNIFIPFGGNASAFYHLTIIDHTESGSATYTYKLIHY